MSGKNKQAKKICFAFVVPQTILGMDRNSQESPDPYWELPQKCSLTHKNYLIFQSIKLKVIWKAMYS